MNNLYIVSGPEQVKRSLSVRERVKKIENQKTEIDQSSFKARKMNKEDDERKVIKILTASEHSDMKEYDKEEGNQHPERTRKKMFERENEYSFVKKEKDEHQGAKVGGDPHQVALERDQREENFQKCWEENKKLKTHIEEKDAFIRRETERKSEEIKNLKDNLEFKDKQIRHMQEQLQAIKDEKEEELKRKTMQIKNIEEQLEVSKNINKEKDEEIGKLRRLLEREEHPQRVEEEVSSAKRRRQTQCKLKDYCWVKYC